MQNMLRVLMVVLLLVSCKENSHVTTRGMYYWKTVYNPGPLENEVLQKTGCEKVYLRLFDVDWNDMTGHAMPVAPVHVKQKTNPAYKYIPVIFITQKTLLHLKREDVSNLAQSINNFTTDICIRSGIDCEEIQLDCDWTVKTKDRYFALINKLKACSFFKGKQISATIRMHQVKYTVASGIPPVDRGLLMCYNLGSIKKLATRNSILEFSEAKKYLDHAYSYPLPLDVALPLFDWCVLFRNKEFKGILKDAKPSSVMTSNSIKADGNNRYVCLSDMVLDGYIIKKNDIIKIEAPALDDIMRTASYTAREVSNDTLSIVLFHCDSITLSKHSIHELEKIYSIYN